MNTLATRNGSLWVREFGGQPARVVALHGFTLHGGMFAQFAQSVGLPLAAPDLPGHGRSRLEPITMGTAVDAVGELLATLDSPLLLGYSQGGRVALQVALTYPGLIGSMVLVGTSPGLQGTARKKRQVADAALASRIERIGIERFVTEWLANPILASDAMSPDAREADRKMRLENNAAGIAAALRGLGQGSVGDTSERIPHLPMPISFVAGEHDHKYAELARTMARSRRDTPVIVAGSGHNVVREAPEAVAAVVRKMLDV